MGIAEHPKEAPQHQVSETFWLSVASVVRRGDGPDDQMAGFYRDALTGVRIDSDTSDSGILDHFTASSHVLSYTEGTYAISSGMHGKSTAPISNGLVCIGHSGPQPISVLGQLGTVIAASNQTAEAF